KDLAERKALYQQVLAKDPDDQAAQEKVLAALAGLGDADGIRSVVEQWMKGREKDPQALVALAMRFQRAGLTSDAPHALEGGYSAENEVAKKQQILMAIGDVYAANKNDENARRLFSDLAAEGLNAEIRELALGRLAGLLHN